MDIPSSNETFGIQCSYELPIAHWITSRKLLAEEADRYPEWEPTLETTREPEEKLIKKDQELRFADRITCPSKFVLDSIPSEIRKNVPCQVAPFGSPLSTQLSNDIQKHKDKYLKILFVGSMSQRKGLADLFKAMRFLKNAKIKLSILGQPSMPMEFYRKQFSNFDYYAPCTNSKVRDVMKKHDALILPSIVEGRALVQQEAMSCGLPIIVTKNAGGEDLIIDGTTGYTVPIRSPEKIAEKILQLNDCKDLLNDMAENCIKKAQTYSWEAYAQTIIDFNYQKADKLKKYICK